METISSNCITTILNWGVVLDVKLKEKSKQLQNKFFKGFLEF